MGYPPVEQVGTGRPGPDRLDARQHLRHHPAPDHAGGDAGFDVADRRPGHQRRRVVDVGHQTADVGEEDHLLGSEGAAEGTGDGVGIDVEGLTVVGDPDGGDDRDHVLGQEPLDDSRADRSDIADETELGIAQLGVDQAAVLAGHADCIGAVAVDTADDVAADLTDEHHPGDVEGLGVGDPETVAERRFLPEASQQLTDLRAATVHHHRAQADRSQHHDVLGEGPEHAVVDDGVASELDHHDRAPEPLDVRQRLQQGRGPQFR